jgi:hypothetical protein
MREDLHLIFARANLPVQRGDLRGGISASGPTGMPALVPARSIIAG